MAEYHFPGHKYTEDDCFFKTIDMSKPEDEFDMFGTSPTSCIDFPADCIDTSALFNFRVVKRRHRHNYCTLAHGADAPPPPAPPSTPTSLTAIANPTSVTAIAIPTSVTANGTPMSSPTATSSTNSIVASTTAAADVDESLNNLFYILDYAPKYKVKVNKEQQRTDAELASLLNVITLSNNASTSSSSSSSGAGGGGGGGGIGSGSLSTPLEHRICAASRTIRKPSTSMKIFKIHRNPKWFFRKVDHEEDSVSAPEYDDSEERELSIFSYRRQCIRRRAERVALRERRLEHSQQQQRMEALMHDFGNAMTFNEV